MDFYGLRSKKLVGKAITHLGFLFFFSGCLVAKDRYDEAVLEMKACSLRTEQCERDLSDAGRSRRTLQSDLQQFEKNHQNLLEQFATLQAEREEMARQIGMFKEKLEAREEQISEMTKTYQEFVGHLSTEIHEGKIRIHHSERGLKLNLVDKILFASGSADLTQRGKDILEKVGYVMKDIKDRGIHVEGHADNLSMSPNLLNRFPSNWELSSMRAAAVVRFLEERVGIDPRLLAATGYSSYQPIASNETQEGRQQNRRIEILLVPLTPEEMQRLYGNTLTPPPLKPIPPLDVHGKTVSPE